MSNQADDNNLDVLIHRRALSTTVVAESRTDAPGALLDTLDSLGFERHGAAIYIWHELPEDLSAAEASRTCLRAHKTLLAAGYLAVLDDRLIQQTP
ncbi:hypothetical protein [Streptomyces sp. NPDC001404]|uniref:hypothetical protein n=1 Tax=Streptomyces sp. NPDC001404 TaxID=3364571 RepID=UPI00368E25F5